MSGHSKWSTIKRKKEVTDTKRGKLFSKLSKQIAVAIATGGGSDPGTNYKLKIAIDQAKNYNMPKINIERLLKKADDKVTFSEIVYEGFGPNSIAVLVYAATDNKNRTSQEIKKIFERGGGQLAGPNAVSFYFNSKGFFLIKKESNLDDQLLKLIDLGAEDVEETGDGIEVFVDIKEMSKLNEQIKEAGYEILQSEFTQKPNNNKTITDKKIAEKSIAFLEQLEDHDDVSRVYSNIDIPSALLI